MVSGCSRDGCVGTAHTPLLSTRWGECSLYTTHFWGHAATARGASLFLPHVSALKGIWKLLALFNTGIHAFQPSSHSFQYRQLEGLLQTLFLASLFELRTRLIWSSLILPNNFLEIPRMTIYWLKSCSITRLMKKSFSQKELDSQLREQKQETTGISQCFSHYILLFVVHI